MGIFTKLEVYKPHRMKAWFWEYNVQAVVLLEGVLLNIFVSYILLGLSLAAPIGPINFAQLDQGIKNGFLHSWFVGLGAIRSNQVTPTKTIMMPKTVYMEAKIHNGTFGNQNFVKSEIPII